MSRRGYTIIELLMAVSVLAIGISGIIALQKVTSVANRQAKDLAIATHIAQTWQERLNADAARWNHPSPVRAGTRDIATDTVWLRLVETSPGAWIQPAFDAVLAQGPAFDALGNQVNHVVNPRQAKFCTHIRLSWLYADDSPRIGNGLVRAEVRVFWLRPNGRESLVPNGICDPTTAANILGQQTNDFHFVYATSAIRQNTMQGGQN